MERVENGGERPAKGGHGVVLWAAIRWLLEMKKERKNNERERKKVGVYIKECDIYNIAIGMPLFQ